MFARGKRNGISRGCETRRTFSDAPMRGLWPLRFDPRPVISGEAGALSMGDSTATLHGPRAACADALPMGLRLAPVLLQQHRSVPSRADAISNLPIERCGMRIAAHFAEVSTRHGFRWRAEEVA
jgi:hypothetical protein